MRREEIYNYQAELRRKDGSTRHVLINSNGLWEDGRFVHTRTFIHDVTERIEMEHALKLVHDELEMRVTQRTAEINQKNAQLRSQRGNSGFNKRGLARTLRTSVSSTGRRTQAHCTRPAR